MTTDRLHFTGDPEADRLLVREPMALLIGFALDQQVSVQKAFSGPLELQRRIGTLDAARIAAMDPAALHEAFRGPPALHRFPGSMARKTQELCAAVDQRYGGDPSRIWREASDAADLRARLRELPGFGPMKVDGMLSILSRRLGVRLAGWESVLTEKPTLGDVDSDEALTRYQQAKRAVKAEKRANTAKEEKRASAR